MLSLFDIKKSKDGDNKTIGVKDFVWFWVGLIFFYSLGTTNVQFRRELVPGLYAVYKQARPGAAAYRQGDPFRRAAAP